MNKLKALLCNERIMLMAIVLNTAVMFIGGFWQESVIFDLSDSLFTLIFLCEAIAKISCYGWKGYWQKGWNKFDFIILIIAIPSFASLFFEHTATSTIFALRSFRLFKSLKMLRFIPNIQKLLKGIKFLSIIFSILSSTIFGYMVPEYFGNPAISLYSIFRLFSIEGWYELPDAIAKCGSPYWGLFARVYFSVLVFSGGIIGMSMINSIFVDAMAEDNNDEVLEKLRSIEDRLDKLSRNQQ